MNCPHCGTGNASDAFVCSSCGTSLVSTTPDQPAPDAPPAPEAPAPASPPPAPAGPPPGPPPAPGAPPQGPPPQGPAGPHPGAAPAGPPPQGPGAPPPGAVPAGPPPTPAGPPPQGPLPPGAPGGYPQQGPPPGYPPTGQQPPYPQEPGAPPGGYPPPGYAPQGPPPPGYPQPAPGYGPPPSGTYPVYPPAGGPAGGKKGRGKVFLLLGALLVVALGAAAFIVTKNDETGTSVGASITLDPITTLGADPFSDQNFDIEQFTGPLSIALADFPDLGEDLGTALAGRVSKGSAPGLYGGSQEVAVCDVDKLLEFLTNPENAAKAEAWAGTLGIEVAGISDYVRGLTPVRLRFDTRVTNHGFKGGQATAVQSLLQAGTGVLVDTKGVPRVKCNCGNPLLEPTPMGDVPSDEEDKTMDIEFVASNPQDAWPGLDPKVAVTVEPGDETGLFTLVDLETGRLFQRKAGTDVKEDTFVRIGDEELCQTLPDSPTCAVGELGSGDVQVTLQWGSQADLDLHVFEPDETEIWYQNKGPTASGGSLDVDSNEQCAPGPAVENVFWSEGTAPVGEYTVIVYGYDFTQDDGSSCGGGEYTLTISVAGEVQTYEGSVGQDEQDEYSFEA